MKTTILEISIHPEDENPIFGERSTHVKLGDDGAGSFIIIEQSTDDYGENQIRLDFEEFYGIVEAVKLLENGKTE